MKILKLGRKQQRCQKTIDAKRRYLYKNKSENCLLDARLIEIYNKSCTYLFFFFCYWEKKMSSVGSVGAQISYATVLYYPTACLFCGVPNGQASTTIIRINSSTRRQLDKPVPTWRHIFKL